MKTPRTIYFWILWYGKRDVLGYVIPTATVAECLRELAKYQADFPCFRVSVGVES